MTSEIQKRRKKVAVQMRDEAFNGKDYNTAIDFLAKFKRACDSSFIHGCAAIELFRELMNSPALDTLMARLSLSLNDGNRQEEIVTADAEVVSHLLRRYVTEAVVVSAGNKICNYNRTS